MFFVCLFWLASANQNMSPSRIEVFASFFHCSALAPRRIHTSIKYSISTG
jgi:hypothetical protein